MSKEQSLGNTGALTGKQFKTLTPDNEKLSHLGGQMIQMEEDFEEMKRTREEARKQLEARFQDVHRKIQNTRDFVASEGKRINDTLIAFQSKFDFQLKNLEKLIIDQHEAAIQDMRQRFQKVDERNDELEKMIEEERQERLKQTEEQLRPIKDKIKELFELLEVEKNERIQKEKEIYQKISDEVFILDEKIDTEKTHRMKHLKDIREKMDYQIKQQQKVAQDFHTKAIEEFNHVANNIEKEMDNRFEHQDKIVDNLSNVVQTFQNTLKVIGSEP